MESQQSQDLPYVDRPDVSEIFADQIRISHFDGYSVRVELAVARPHRVAMNQAESSIYPVARLVLTPLAALALNDQLSAIISALEKGGMLKRIAPSSDKKQ